MMKKLFIFLVITSVALSLISCGGSRKLGCPATAKNGQTKTSNA
jgi:hypothetical protein